MSLTGAVFTVGSGNVTIDRTGNTMSVSGVQCTAANGFMTKTLAQIKTALDGCGANLSGTAIYDGTNKLDSVALGEVLDAGTAVTSINLKTNDHGSAGTPPAGGYYKSEIYDQIAWLNSVVNASGNITDPQTGAIYTARSFGFPYDVSVVNARLAALHSGYADVGSAKVLGTVTGTIEDAPYTNNIDMYAVFPVDGKLYLHLGTTVGQTYTEDETKTRRSARALGFAIAHSGLVLAVLGHAADEVSANEWTWAVDEWSKFGDQLKVMSHQKFRDYIATGANGWTNNGDGTFSRTYTNGAGNYLPSPGSPAINAGTPVGLTTDYAGTSVPRGGAVDIGAFESSYLPAVHLGMGF